MHKKILLLSVLCFSLILLIIGCQTVSVPGPAPSPVTAPALPAWWVDSTFYEIFVRSFYDSNGDGIGDLNGITAKLDYLNDGNPATTTDLGVTGIWLMPINPSPSYHGYDVTDYYGINPEYGTLTDFKNLINQAHARGIRVIIDLVLNHCSNQHPWFTEKPDWFIWSGTNPGYLGPWGEQVWYPSGGRYYYGVFWSGMPDLNYTNSAVVTTMEGVVRYWLEDVGVDGFRLDAVRYIIEEGASQADTASTHNFWKGFRVAFKNISPEAIAVGEAWADLSLIAKYVEGDELDGAFNFSLASAIIDAANNGLASSYINSLVLSTSLIPAGYFSPFITNHDQNRTMSQLVGSVPKAKVAASLLLTSPGTPFMYYGEEIGMEGIKPDENIRLPMEWVTVAAQTGDASSLFSHYRNLIALRNGHAALRAGSFNSLTASNSRICASLRFLTSEAIVAIVNVGGSAVTNGMLSRTSSPLTKGDYLVSPLMGAGTFEVMTVGDNGAITNYLLTATVPAYGTIVLDLQPK